MLCVGGLGAQYVKRRAADPSVSSEDAHQMARTWIQKCLESHDECYSENIRYELPARLLKVTTDIDLATIKLDPKPPPGATYVAISYCKS